MFLDDQLFNIWIANKVQTMDQAYKTLVKMLTVCINKLTEYAAKHPEGVPVDEVKRVNNSWNLAISRIRKETDIKNLPENMPAKYIKEKFPEDAHLLD